MNSSLVFIVDFSSTNQFLIDIYFNVNFLVRTRLSLFLVLSPSISLNFDHVYFLILKCWDDVPDSIENYAKQGKYFHP